MKVIVIGGGASGLVSAITAARNGIDVTILERNQSCGKKILVTGNGKCNYYNKDQNISHYHSTTPELIYNIINENNCQMVLDFFDKIGVIPKIKNGYYYPFSNQAVSILNALLNEINNLSVNIVCDTYVKEIIKNNNTFIIKTNNKEYRCDKVVVASGSYAYYKNTEINSYDLLKKLNHKIIKPLPALVQLKIDNPVTKKWTGVRVDSKLTLYEEGIKIKEETGELMLTSYGISGICAMQLSGYIARGIYNSKKEEIKINFVPSLADTKEQLITYLDNLSNKLKNRTVTNILDSILNYKLGNAIIHELHINENKKFNDLTYQEKEKLADKIVNYNITITQTNTFNEAQVASGGISLTDVNVKTLESLKVKGLYIVGELLDIYGDCGGYNLTLAWITGIISGKSISEENY